MRLLKVVEVVIAFRDGGSDSKCIKRGWLMYFMRLEAVVDVFHAFGGGGRGSKCAY